MLVFSLEDLGVKIIFTGPLGHPLFFVHLVLSNRPIFLEFSNKKRSNDVVKPFFTWNNSFNLKNEHSNNIEKNRDKNRNIFTLYFVNPNMWMLTFNVVLGYQGLQFQDFLWFVFLVFFLIQPTNPIQWNLY